MPVPKLLENVRPGDIVQNMLVLEVYPWESAFAPLLLCKCRVCGAEREYSSVQMSRRQFSGALGCPACRYRPRTKDADGKPILGVRALQKRARKEAMRIQREDLLSTRTEPGRTFLRLEKDGKETWRWTMPEPALESDTWKRAFCERW